MVVNMAVVMAVFFGGFGKKNSKIYNFDMIVFKFTV